MLNSYLSLWSAGSGLEPQGKGADEVQRGGWASRPVWGPPGRLWNGRAAASLTARYRRWRARLLPWASEEMMVTHCRPSHAPVWREGETPHLSRDGGGSPGMRGRVLPAQGPPFIPPSAREAGPVGP